MVTLAQFGMTTGFLLGLGDDRRCRLVLFAEADFPDG